ncbi:Nsp1_C domain-containing protein [Meloidogyne graminicola]|uniref:Nsp1_C domain-containing protein n=1 Tax=Meloidogyne graminicola TaxID=189291 RepID=A0A8S9ZRT9_9BILA|nr:Nsp1_C domain-containing protein [Meloidogyne graminicola]
MRIDFEEQEKQFLDEVDDLNAFDIILRKAQEKLSKIRNDVDEIEQEKLRFYWETDILAQQQEELEKIVKSFESQLQTQSISTISGSQDNATPADVERRNM